jgi:hypothetical protein
VVSPAPDPLPQTSSSWLARLFISPDERRLRAAWRLALHGLLYLILLGLMGIPIIVVTFLVFPQSLGSAGPAGLAELLAIIPSLGAILLATWIARRLLDRRSFVSLGFRVDRRALFDLTVGFGIPAVMMGLIFLLETSLGAVHFEGWAWETIPPGQVVLGLLAGFAFFLGVGLNEETLSRGYQLQNLVDGLGLRWGLVVSSAIFAALHLGNPNVTWYTVIPGLVAAGYFLAFGWLRTGQLWLSIGLHLGWNFFEGTVFGFPVSGLQLFQLIHQKAVGPSLLTGGAFGPEAGLVLLPGLAVGTFLVWLYTRGRLAKP